MEYWSKIDLDDFIEIENRSPSTFIHEVIKAYHGKFRIFRNVILPEITDNQLIEFEFTSNFLERKG